MKEIRKDYLLNRWVYYSTKRKDRPREFAKKLSVCYFCPGNEHLTPKEIGRVEEKGEWKIRWFPNKFPVLDSKTLLKANKNKFLNSISSYGMHEVIAETSAHKKQLFDLSVEHIAELLKVYSLRIKALSKLKNVKYVVVFKNHGKEAGTSLIHSHTQVVALPKIPSLIEEKLKAVKNFKKCPYCSIIKAEKNSKRKVFENKSFVSFAPYASRFNYEVWVFPKKHIRNITELNDEEFKDLAIIFKKMLLKLKKLNCSYNFFLHYAPKGTDLHFHIEFMPRISVFGGFEYSSNDIINSVMPEMASKFYRS